ncbi:hypothetical protein Tco_1500294 [Tanacetum coccineum]
MPHDSPLSGGNTPKSDEGSKKLTELTELCTKLFDRVTSLEQDLKQTKQVYGKAITKLVKKVKHLEDRLKYTKARRKAKLVISNEDKDLVLEDPSKQRRLSNTEYEEAEYDMDQTDTLHAAKILVEASRERVKTYNRRRRSTDSSRDSTARGLFSTAEEILSTDERIAQKLNEEKLAKAAARKEQERIDFEKAQELQNIQERRSDSIKRYQTLKKKPVSVAQARKNMMIFLKNMAGYKMTYFKGMSYDDIGPRFEEEYKKLQTLFKKDTGVEKIKTKTKRVAEETLLQESFKKLRTAKATSSEPIQEQSTEEPKELSEEDLKNILVKERFRAAEPSEDMEKALWVELKRLFELDKDDVLWKLQRYMHDPLTWRLYGSSGVHHVSFTKGHDIYMLTEKDYPLTTTVMGLMLSIRLQVEEDSEMGDYEMWKLRIKQYFQVQDYAIWDVIENGNSFNPVARTTANVYGTSTLIILGPVTTEEKAQKKNDVKARSMLFGGNDATKKTQKTLMKQIYENFNAPSTESLDSIFSRLQKIVSQMAILSENISQEDLNLKFLRSLSSEWNTNVVVWRNKPDLETMSFDDLYNNFKIVKQEVKRTVPTSSSSGSQNMAFVSSLGSTNEVDTANIQVSTISTPVSTASTHDDTAKLSDATVYAFLTNHPNGSQLNASIVIRWDILQGNAEVLGTKKAGLDEEVPTNIALMAFSDSEVHNDKTCSNTYLKSFETLKTQYDNLRIEFNKFEFDLATYKRGLASVEEQLVFYKKNEVMFYDQIVVLKRDASFKDSKINALNMQIEKLKKEKENNQIKIDNFENASKSLDKLIGSQIIDKSRKGMGFESYNAVAPPPTGLFAPLTIDLSNSGLEEFQQPEFEGYGIKVNKSVSENSSNEIKKSPDAPIIEE